MFVAGVLVAVAEYDEGGDRLSGGVVCGADDCGLSDCQVADQRGFHFGRGDSVSGNVHDVVDAAPSRSCESLSILPTRRDAATMLITAAGDGLTRGGA